jgi:hypothetical protein
VAAKPLACRDGPGPGFKVGLESRASVTVGLPVVRTSVDGGTAVSTPGNHRSRYAVTQAFRRADVARVYCRLAGCHARLKGQ